MAGQSLTLNGVGLRVKRKLGIGVKVYVAGLYGKAQSSTADVWLNSSDAQSLVLVFLRSLAFRKALLAISIGQNPPTEDLEKRFAGPELTAF